jgi:hypothetical protein
MNITNSTIDNVSVRRVLLSTAVLQDQIVRCCCRPASSSSSSSSSSVITRPGPDAQPVLNIGQRATAVTGAVGAVQIAVTVLNSGATLAEDLVVTVNLSPALLAGEYQLHPAPGWREATLAKLKSVPVALQPGKAQTLSFQIAPVKPSAPITVTSTASATTSNRGVIGLARPLRATIGG